jgi:hypothetical protein
MKFLCFGWFLELVFIFLKRFYATASIYEDAAKSIVEAFPYLKDDSETGFVNKTF